MKRDFISINDLTVQDVDSILKLASQIKKSPARVQNALKAKTFALIFQKPSNRTRVSFETGIFQLGGNTIYLGPQDIDLGKREPTSDIAKTMSRFVDGIVARVFLHSDLLSLARQSTVPVINALSDLSHPCQGLADVMTVNEKFGRLKGIRIAYIGDGNNVCNSLILACAKTGMSLTIATPRGYEPSADYVKSGLGEAKKTGAVISLTRSAEEAVQGAQVIYTDTWVSMGQEEEKSRRLSIFKGFQVNEKLIKQADSEFIFMHCLPAHRGQEVTAAVIDGPRSVIFDQAENRLHAQKAVLMMLYKK